MNPLVSVIIPVLNEKANLKALLESLLEQDHRPLEVLVVDGGSKDGSYDEAQKFSEAFGDEEITFRVLRETGPCRGPANARNNGLGSATGEYLMFLDADFRLSNKQTVSEIVDALEEHATVGILTLPACQNWLEKEQWLDRFDRRIGGVPHTFCAYRRSAIEHVAFNPQLGFGEDQDFHARAGGDIHYLPIYVERHFVHDLREWTRQVLWYGSTYPRYMAVRGRQSLARIVAWVHPPILVVMALLTSFLAPWASWIPIGLLALSLGISFARAKNPSAGRLAYILFARVVMTTVVLAGFILGSLRLLGHKPIMGNNAPPGLAKQR